MIQKKSQVHLEMGDISMSFFSMVRNLSHQTEYCEHVHSETFPEPLHFW